MAALLWAAVIAGLCVAWLINLMVNRRCVCRCGQRMDGKTVLITGADSGIGRATATDLARRGARVIMAGINIQQARAVSEEIIEETENWEVVARYVDLSCMSSVRTLAEEVLSSEKRLDVLLHNAGVLLPRRPVTEEGLNTLLATNTYGPFLLTVLLVELLKRTPQSRVVFVSSIAHAFRRLDLNDPNPLTPPTATSTFLHNSDLYCKSKYVMCLYTQELARRLHGTGVTVNCLHPGVVNTNIGNDFWLIRQSVIRNTIMTILGFKTPEQGAQTSIHLSVSDDLRGVTGQYFKNCKRYSFGKIVQDPALWAQAWRVCEEIVRLRPSDPQIPCPDQE